LSKARQAKAFEVEPISVTLSRHFGQNVLVIVVPQSSAQFVVVHILLGFLVSPLSGNLVGVQQTKFTLDWESFPDDDLLELVRAVKEFKEKLPKLNLTGGSGQRQETAIVFFVEIRAAADLFRFERRDRRREVGERSGRAGGG
jgi:hypothetical protein